MKNKIKLIWDFFGIDALNTAKHHEIHLNEYIKNNNLNACAGHDQIDHHHSIAYIIVEKEFMILVRDHLKPHRGEWYNDKS